jgi:AmmeMemoRadiSam system protein B
MATISPIRSSPIAGSWYSSNSSELAREIDLNISQAVLPDIDGEVVGILAPHAGYLYSGATAGYAFRAVKDREYELVVILSPYHPYHNATLLSSAHQMYSTPLGLLSIDQKILQELKFWLAKSDFQLIQLVNDKEHSLEIEIPFLQRALKGEFLLLPLMIRHLEPYQAEVIAKILFHVIRHKNALVVMSSDLSHFYPQPIAKQLDTEILNTILSYSPENVFQTEAGGRGYACGLGAILVGMELTRLLGGNEIKLLSYSTSGDRTGDFQSVVGYGAAAFIKSNPGQKTAPQ